MHKCIKLIFSDLMSMTFSVDIFTVCIYVSMYSFVYLFIHIYVCLCIWWWGASVVLSYGSILLTNNVRICMYVCMYLCMYICILFPAIHGYNYYSYESILFHVPIGKRSHICSREWGCGRGWEDIVGEARPY